MLLCSSLTFIIGMLVGGVTVALRVDARAAAFLSGDDEEQELGI